MMKIVDIINTPCETVLPADWGSYRMLYIRTASGDYDLLCDQDGEPVTNKNLQVERIESFFGKHFQPALLEGTECLAHVVNKSS
jgi:hypothetical protein